MSDEPTLLPGARPPLAPDSPTPAPDPTAAESSFSPLVSELTASEKLQNPFEPNVSSVSIVVPAYNEEGGIAFGLESLQEVMDASGLTYEIIVVNDGSTDDTVAQVAAFPRVRLLQHAVNLGYGAALKTGIRRSRYDTIIITDADGTYPSDRIPDLIAVMNETGADMVVGARTGENVNIPSIRRPAKWVLRQLARYLTRTHIPDLNSGLRVMRKEIIFEFMGMLPSGFSFTTTITLAMLTNDYQVRYLPINYLNRVGHSKIKPIRDTLNFLVLIIRTILAFNPLRVLLPPGLALSLLAVLKVFYDFYFWDWSIRRSTIALLMAAFQVMVLAVLADLIVMQTHLIRRK